jgi:hypothetical protein
VMRKCRKTLKENNLKLVDIQAQVFTDCWKLFLKTSFFETALLETKFLANMDSTTSQKFHQLLPLKLENTLECLATNKNI